jgi:hypothetical protein
MLGRINRSLNFSLILEVRGYGCQLLGALDVLILDPHSVLHATMDQLQAVSTSSTLIQTESLI